MASDIAISVVMPTFNQATRLGLTLSSLLCQRPPQGGWEVIVADDGSTDDTASVLDAFVGQLPLRALRQRNAGRAAARNAAATIAVGRTLVFCDSDRVCGPSFVALHGDAAAHSAAVRVNLGEVREAYVADVDGGRAELLEDIGAGCARLARRSRRPHFVAEIYRHLFTQDGTAHSAFAWLCFLSGNVSLARSLFEQAGGFDEDFVEWGFEHFELGYRLAGLGAEFWHCPDAVNYHLAHRREPGFYERGIAASAALLRCKHPQLPVDALVNLVRGEISLDAFLAPADPLEMG